MSKFLESFCIISLISLLGLSFTSSNVSASEQRESIVHTVTRGEDCIDGARSFVTRKEHQKCETKCGGLGKMSSFNSLANQCTESVRPYNYKHGTQELVGCMISCPVPASTCTCRGAVPNNPDIQTTGPVDSVAEEYLALEAEALLLMMSE